MSARRDLDQLGKTVSDLCLGECAEESEVEESVNRSMIGSETVLVVAVVDGNLDRDRCINQTNYGGGNSNEISVAAVGCAGETGNVSDETASNDENGFLVDDQSRIQIC